MHMHKDHMLKDIFANKVSPFWKGVTLDNSAMGGVENKGGFQKKEYDPSFSTPLETCTTKFPLKN